MTVQTTGQSRTGRKPPAIDATQPQTGLLARLHGAALRRLHEALVDRRYARFETVRTDGMRSLDETPIASPNRAYVTHYAPTPRLVMDWLHACLPRDLARWTFLDLGAGLGRAVLCAAERPYARVLGVEFATRLAAMARSNVWGYPRSRIHARDVQIACADAAALDVPEGPLVVFLFNPFGDEVLRDVVANLETAYADAARPIVVAVVNPIEIAALESSQLFARRSVPRAVAVKTKLFSPYRLALFATPDAVRHLPG